MFGSLKIAIIFVIIGLAGGGVLYVKKLQNDLETAQANVAKMEVAVQISEASLKLVNDETARLGDLNTQLSTDLQKAEQYGDELRATLQRHNLTHLATKKPGLIQPRMQGATDELWNDLESITSNTATSELQSTDSGSTDTNSN
jgi:hypothetical protein|tara:strand:+ start:233 stop:664 length:432 start_codon:yes stop_codon:yes gene_type:complete